MRIVLISFLLISSTAMAGWVQKADFGGVARHRTTTLNIGNKIYMGLGHYNGAGPNILFNDWWEYDPATNAWTQKANYGGGICYHAAGFTINDIGYVGTGRITPSGNTLVQDFYKYNPTTNSWTQITSLPGLPRRGAVGFELGGYGYLGTGEINSGSGRTGTFYRFDPGNETWLQIASLPVARTSSVAFSIDSYGYVGTGNTDWGSANDFWRYDPGTNTWTQLPNVGPTNRQEAMGFSIDGRGYIGTGDDYSSGNNFADMWEFDPGTNAWTQLPDFPGTARRYLGAIHFGSVAFAGLGTNGTNFKDFWMFGRLLSSEQLEAIDQLELLAYPNPSAEYVSFDWGEMTNDQMAHLEIEIIDMNGKVLTQEEASKDMIIDTRLWERGTYIYRLKYQTNYFKTGKLIKH